MPIGSRQAVHEIQFTRYTQQDFKNIQTLGCDVIQFPINLYFMTDGAPDYKLDPLFLTFLDSAMNWAEGLGMHLILDNHTFDPAVRTGTGVGDTLKVLWPQLALIAFHAPNSFITRS